MCVRLMTWFHAKKRRFVRKRTHTIISLSEQKSRKVPVKRPFMCNNNIVYSKTSTDVDHNTYFINCAAYCTVARVPRLCVKIKF